MKTSLIVVVAALSAACSEPRPTEPPRPVTPNEQVETAPLPNQNTVRCDKLMAEMRALRDGPQPCASFEDCWVFHNGEHWDGCPVEVNKTNNAILVEMRKEIDGLDCPVDKGAMCAAQEIIGCLLGGCGGKSPPAPAAAP